MREKREYSTKSTKVHGFLYSGAGCFLALFYAVAPVRAEVSFEDLQAQVTALTEQVNAASIQNQEVVRVLRELSSRLKGLPLSLNVGDISGTKNTTVDIPISFVEGDTDVSALQFDLELPIGISSGTVMAGPASTAAEKGVKSSFVAGNVRVLIFGLNQNPLASGVLATVRFKINSTASLGNSPLRIKNVAASDPNGIVVNLATNDGSITVN